MHGTGFLAIWSDLAPEDATRTPGLPGVRPTVGFLSEDIGSVPKGGVKVCQRPFVN
jgi:hypothetical protein